MGSSKQYPVTMDSLQDMLDFVREEISVAGFDEHCSYKILTAVDEALTNIILYSGLSVPSQLTITCQNAIPAGIIIVLEDDGKQYNPLNYPPPNIENGDLMEERSPGGFGIYLIGKLMDKVEYCREKQTNKLILTKFLK